MARKRYPYISECKPMKGNGGGPCCCCDQRSTHRLTVEVSWMRGDDEVYHVCAAHRPTPQTLDRLWQLMDEKQKKATVSQTGSL